jgi:hypothetical protein
VLARYYRQKKVESKQAVGLAHWVKGSLLL